MPSASDPRAGMSLIVRTITRLVASFILLFGIYVALYGHLSPGGGFAGGVIVACGLILMLLAFGKEYVVRFVSERAPIIWGCFGALAFLLFAAAGYLGGAFFLNLFSSGEPFHLFGGGIIPLYDMAIGVEVGACLFAVFLALAIFRFPQGEDKKGTSGPPSC